MLHVRHEVGGILRPEHLLQVHSALPNRILNPEGLAVQVTHLAQAFPLGDADGCAGVYLEVSLCLYPEVPQHTLQANGLASRRTTRPRLMTMLLSSAFSTNF